MTTGKIEKPLYDVNEKVLCKCEDGLNYEAKIVRVGRAEDGGLYYKVHYQGWSKTYDEIILEDMVASRFVNFTPQALQDALNAQNARREMDRIDKERKSKRRNRKLLNIVCKEAEDEKLDDEDFGPARRQSVTSSSCSEELNGFAPFSTQTDPSPKLEFGSESGIEKIETSSGICHDEFFDENFSSNWVDDSLLFILEKDRQMIEEKHMLPRLPSKYTANKIVNEYAKYVRQVNKANRNNLSGERGTRWKLFMKAFDECLQAFLDFFDIALQDRVLNDVEKSRHEDLINNGVVNAFDISDIFEETKQGLRPSQCYGFIYIVRLLADFEDILRRWSAPGATVQVFEIFVKGFLKWLSKCAAKYLDFEVDYQDLGSFL